jgi:hypothetical protein
MKRSVIKMWRQGCPSRRTDVIPSKEVLKAALSALALTVLMELAVIIAGVLLTTN